MADSDIEITVIGVRNEQMDITKLRSNARA